MRGVIEIHDLVVSFGDRRVLDRLAFSVPEGSMFGFVGPNGAGKTTTMRCLLEIVTPDSGELTVLGAAPSAATRRLVGYMPEERGLYPKMTAARQIAYFAQLNGAEAADANARALALLARLGLSDRGDEPVEKLSLGNQQRVQLAVALAHEPRLLILDEPFSGLDPLGVDALAEVLAERVADGVSVLFSSHQLELVERLCSHIAIIRDGTIVATGGVQRLRREASEDRIRIVASGAADLAALAAPFGDVEQRSATDIVVSLRDGADDQALLDRIRAEARVERFGAELRTLSEIYRLSVDGPQPARRAE